jgi:hypothetical protein
MTETEINERLNARYNERVRKEANGLLLAGKEAATLPIKEAAPVDIVAEINENTTAYVSVSEADSYHSERISAEAWGALDTATKQRRLISASDFLDFAYRFAGEKTDPAQSREFPRMGGADIPQVVKYAVCELALQEDLTANPESEMSSVTVGAVHVAYRNSGQAKAGQNRFTYVKSLLSSVLAFRGNGVELLRG